jgi:hypothetical protein
LRPKTHVGAIYPELPEYRAIYTRRRAFRAFITSGRFWCLVLVQHRFSSILWCSPVFERNLKPQIDSLRIPAYYILNPYS